MPHHSVISALVNIGVRGAAFSWFNSFLTGQKFCVRIEQVCSIRGDVISGVVQGSMIGPALYTIFINPLLKKLSFPCQAFADDLKFIADVIENNQEKMQQEVSSIVQWADENQAPLSIDKSSVLHCGRQEKHNTYYIHNSAIKAVGNWHDLGIIHSSGCTYIKHYKHLVSSAHSQAELVQ